jgi:hypothetical protein
MPIDTPGLMEVFLDLVVPLHPELERQSAELPASGFTPPDAALRAAPRPFAESYPASSGLVAVYADQLDEAGQIDRAQMMRELGAFIDANRANIATGKNRAAARAKYVYPIV